MSGRVKALLLGFDAACWEYLDPLLEAGELPHLAGLMSSGISGTLRSTMPPWTPTAWASILTGKNPGRHGAFDMLWKRPGSYEFEPASSRTRLGAPVWHYLNNSGLRVGLVNVPFLYPVEPVDGFALAGFGAPLGFRDLAYPADVLGSVESKLGPYQPAVEKSVLRSGIADDILAQERLHQARLVDAAIMLTIERPIDVLIINLMLLDHANHKLPEMGQVQQAIRSCDIDIGRLVNQLEPDNVLLFSDHGSKRVTGKFLLHGWLCDYGYQVQEVRRGQERREAINWILAQWLREIRSTTGFREKLTRKALLMLLPRLSDSRTGRFWDAVEASIPFSRDYVEQSERVDHTRSGIIPGSIYSGLLYFNLRGREPTGVIPFERVDEWAEELCDLLRRIEEPKSGKPLFSAVHRSEEIFEGAQTYHGPDLILDSFGGEWNIQTRHYTPRVAERADGYFVGPQGDFGWHAKDGIYVFTGSSFKAASRAGKANVMDIAPTLLHLMDIPVPEDYDGSSMETVFTPEHLSGHPLTSQKVERLPDRDLSSGFSASESQAVSEHLRALGYLE